MNNIISSLRNSDIITGGALKKRVAINGFGRIGRAFLKLSINNPLLEVVAINDLGDIHNMIYLLTYDTVYKKSEFEAKAYIVNEDEKYIEINYKSPNGINKKMLVRFLQIKDPALLPWRGMDIDIVIESTGLYTSYDKANIHITSGAKHVIISAPAKEGDNADIKGETILMGINESMISSHNITSNASCTTNASSPLISILDDALGIEKAMLNTVHAYTASQSIVDGPNKKDFREGRAGAQNIVPSSTGAAIAITKVFTNLKSKFDGIAMRVPVPAGSLIDITFISKKITTTEEVNQILLSASKTAKWSRLFYASNEELVSSDVQGSSYACIADLKMTRVVDGNLVKVLGWYDNEIGYTNTLLNHAELVSKK
jgi:glyceraldehyde 3-phosphate dehydrogenase